MCFAFAILLNGLTDVHSASAQALARFSLTLPGATVNITDLSGAEIGEGIHEGEINCNPSENCNKKTHLSFLINTAEYEYRFSEIQAIDIEARRAIVAGVGTVIINGQRNRFLFTATFEDIGFGNISTTYVASRPDASFLIPSTPGVMEITHK